MSHLLKPHPDRASLDLLHRTLDLLEAAFFEPPGPPPDGPGSHLVAVRSAGRAVELGLVAVTDDLVGELAGFVAPADWWGLGVVASGRARHLDGDDPGSGGGVGSAAPWPVDVVHVVARTGESAAAHRHRAVAPAAGSSTSGRSAAGPRGSWQREAGDGSSWAGLVDDHLRRALDLPTPPVPPSTAELWTAVWLDDLATRAAGGGLATATWADLVAHHPVLALAEDAGAGPDVLAWTARQIVRAGALLAGTWTWPVLREAARSGRDVLGTTTPELAEWMDDGLYARVHLAPYPPVDDLLDLLDSLLNPSLAARLRAVVRAWSGSL
jgi:hypothetical protein